MSEFKVNEIVSFANTFISLSCEAEKNEIEDVGFKDFFMGKLADMKSANIIVYKSYCVQTGSYKNSELTITSGVQDLEIPELLELRAFNISCEIHAVRIKNRFIIRILKDRSSGDVDQAYIQLLSLYGSQVEDLKGKSRIIEPERGLEYTVPFQCQVLPYKSIIGGKLVEKRLCDIFAISISYIGFDEDGVPYTKDSRLAGYARIDKSGKVVKEEL